MFGMRSESTEQGKKGELLARTYLSKKGYKILESNFRSRRGEVDLIARKGESLTFVEVKFRTNLRFGSGAESIHPVKQRRMVQALLRYLQKMGIRDREIRLAALLIYEPPSKERQSCSGPVINFFEFPLDLPHQYY